MIPKGAHSMKSTEVFKKLKGTILILSIIILAQAVLGEDLIFLNQVLTNYDLKKMLEFEMNIVGLIVLFLLCSSLENYIGTIKILLTYLGLDIVIAMAAILCASDLKNNIYFNERFTMGIVGIQYLVFAFAGVLCTLELIRKGGQSSLFGSKSAKARRVLVWLVAYLIVRHIAMQTFFVYLYVFSLGMLVGLVLSIQNKPLKNIMNKSLFFRKVQIQAKKYPATLVLIVVCVLSFILNITIVDKHLLQEIYGEASFRAWIDFCLDGGDNGYVAQWLLMDFVKVHQGQSWRLLTLGFTHKGLVHLIMNMPALYFSGKYVEAKIGTFKMVFIYLCSSISVGLICMIEGSYTESFGGSSLSIYAIMTIFLIYSFKKNNGIESRFYELGYVLIYFIFANVPLIGFCGNYHMISFTVGYVGIVLLEKKLRSLRMNHYG